MRCSAFHVRMVSQNTKLNLRFTRACISLLVAPSGLALADVGTDAPVELDPYYILVSTRTPLSLERVSPSVDYTPSEEMEFWQDESLIDTLQRTPGLTLWSNGSIGSVSSLSSRGTESNHTGFFLDGRRLNPGFGNQYDLEFLSLSNVQSVEVQKGASTVNYGSSGIGGVVDVRLDSGLNRGEIDGNTFVEIGSNDYRRAGFRAALGSETVGFSFSGSASQTDNERMNDAYENMNFASKFEWKLTQTLFFEWLAQYSDTEKELPGQVTAPTPFDEQDTENWMLSPGIRYATDELSVHLFYSRSERDAEIYEVNSAFDYSVFPAEFLGDFPIVNEIEVETDEVNLQVDYSLNDDVLLSAGMVYRYDKALNTNINTFSPLDPPVPYSESFQQWGGYAQLIWRITEAFELRAGSRYDDYSDFDDETTGNAELIYYLDNLDAALFAKAATSYAPPSAVDLAFDSDQTTPLNAEKSRSYEIGYRQRLMNQRLVYSLVFFRNEIDELLSFNPANFDTINIEEAVTQGVEVSVEYSPFEKLSLGLGYTYQLAVADRLDDPRTAAEAPDFAADPADNVRLARRPRHLLQLSAAYQFTNALSAGIQAVGQFDREDIDPATFLQVKAEDFFVVRGVVDWQIDEDWTIYCRVENLFDEEYASAAGFPALGRTGYIGARYNF